ncbi:MAG: 3-isopropylmalate dehydrogenase [Gammaproteobacteria bacterium]|nr:3-isopropylmalate dehydrogenase [Gammaproteobacteria bacterium]
MASKKILVLPGDGIGAELMPHALQVMRAAVGDQADIEYEEHDFGGIAIDKYGTSMRNETLEKARSADAVLLGAVGGPKWDDLPVDQKPEKGLLGLRSGLECYANLRPAMTFAPLANASSLKHDLVSGLDILIVRELVGGIYFGEPRGVEVENNVRVGRNTLVYDETEISRIAKTAFQLAQKRNGKVCSVDKANVLEVTQLWRDVVIETHADYPDVELSHMYVDNAAMQLVRQPKQFDVIVTGNMFGDILSDVAAMLTGSLGMLPSASLNDRNQGIYEPVHGTAPDIAGLNIANPLAMILSMAMMLRFSLGLEQAADEVEAAVNKVLGQGLRTRDIHQDDPQNSTRLVSTDEMSAAVIDSLG